jgi:hypothetical protein
MIGGFGYFAAEVRPRFFSATRVAQEADAVVPASRTNVPDNLAVDGTRDAVLQLEVHLGNRVLGEHRSVRDITCEGNQLAECPCRRWRANGSIDMDRSPHRSWRGGIRTDGRRLDHVADGEPLDGLILGSASRAVGATDGLDVAAAWRARG